MRLTIVLLRIIDASVVLDWGRSLMFAHSKPPPIDCQDCSEQVAGNEAVMMCLNSDFF